MCKTITIALVLTTLGASLFVTPAFAKKNICRIALAHCVSNSRFCSDSSRCQGLCLDNYERCGDTQVDSLVKQTSSAGEKKRAAHK